MRTRWRRRAPWMLATLALVAQLLAVPVSAAPLEPARQAPTHVVAPTSATVVVYGGTPGGIMAAIAARRSGAASVVLVEPTGHVGGMMTSGLNATDWGDPATIGGISREFFARMESVERSRHGRYNFQSKNAERVFKAMLAEAGVSVRYNTRLAESATAVTKSGTRITAITMTSGEAFAARVFVDASYEGDLMARAGVRYVVGREPRSQYGEELAGVRPAQLLVRDATGIALGFPVAAPGAVGSGDGRVQASNFRVCLSTNPANQVAFRRPAGYDPANYEIVVRYVAERTAKGQTPRLDWLLWTSPVTNAKYDANDYGAISIAVPGANYAYADGSYAQRAQVVAWHRAYDEGFLYFLRTDPRLPSAIRAAMSAYGLCKDEFTDNTNWPYQLYVREGRRMLGPSVLTSHDIAVLRSKPDIVAIGSYMTDAHYVSRFVSTTGSLLAEGLFWADKRSNYAIPYSVLTPNRSQATNLLVPVTISASHVAHASLRMEPQYMMMGEAAGTAAALAAAGTGVVQDVAIGTLQSRLRARGSVLTDPGDIGTSQFYGDILWAYRAGVMSPCGDGRFCPNGAVTREMMAAFLVRALHLPPATRDYFTDDARSPFQDAINRVAQAGITRGCTTTRFCPTSPVNREQMASFLVRAFALPPAPRDAFTDDARSIHQADINRLAASGITRGCSTTTFCPTRVVTRGEMMAFLHRALSR